MSDIEILCECVYMIRMGKTMQDIRNYILIYKKNLIAAEIDMFISTVYDSLTSHGG
jgi:hypothetical protein